MGQRLWEISGLAFDAGIVFLRKQAEIVGNGDYTIEQRLRLLDIAGERIGIRQPQAAGEESSFDRLYFVGDFTRVVSRYEAVPHHVFLDRRDRAADPRIRRWQ